MTTFYAQVQLRADYADTSYYADQSQEYAASSVDEAHDAVLRFVVSTFAKWSGAATPTTIVGCEVIALGCVLDTKMAGKPTGTSTMRSSRPWMMR